MKLYEELPDRLIVGRKTYLVDLDFRNVLRMLEELRRDDLIEGAREYRALKCIMRHPPRNTGPALRAARELLFPTRKESGTHERLTDFEQDADLIRAAFLQTYGIDLFQEKLHWLEFSSLLGCIPEGTRYADILGIRSRPVPAVTKWNSEQRAAIIRAKQACALDMTQGEQEEQYRRSVVSVAASLKGLIRSTESR